MNQKAILPQDLPVPPEFKEENYERRNHETVFHRLDLAVEFIPGNNNVGAIVKGFLNGIPKHDDIVKLVEQKWDEVDEMTTLLKKKNRLFRNLDSAYNALLTSPEDFDEYLELIPRMHNMEQRLQVVKETEIRVKLETEYKRFLELQAQYGELLALQQELHRARDDRDKTRDDLLRLESEMHALKEQERILSLKVSDDHIAANERDVFVGELFPNVRTGFILARFNLQNTEDMLFDHVLSLIKATKPPHRAVFRRYDMRKDPFTLQWGDLESFRARGTYIADPRITHVGFVNACVAGDLSTVRTMIAQGEDPNCYDYAHVSALHAAAVSSHADIVDFLLKQGANMESRDLNAMTPLLGCVRRGVVDMVRLLLDFGADRYAVDRLNRNALYMAVESGNVNCVKLFLKTAEMVNAVEETWGFTPLHLAANLGKEDVVKALVQAGASFYRRTKKNQTAEELALESKHERIAEYLRHERLNAPGQCIYEMKDTSIAYWIGDYTALNPLWRLDVGITHAIVILVQGKKPPLRTWMVDTERMETVTFLVDIHDEDDITRYSWVQLSEQLPEMLNTLAAWEETPHAQILICDDTGVNVCAAILTAYFIVRRQYRYEHILKALEEARPAVCMSLSLRRGLDQLQRRVDEKKMKRLDSKVRNSTALSVAF